MRGTLRIPVKQFDEDRLITDHPRACGELIAVPHGRDNKTGSSPRMRGTRGVVLMLFGCLRIIPAHAGNSLKRRNIPRAEPDHPRACGELALCADTIWGSFGSSPRMRGTQDVSDAQYPPIRIIPAHAGNSPMPPHATALQPDHPRACGELTRMRC